MSFTPYIEAEYESGFILREDEQDHSPYDAGKNVFHAILNKRAVAAHGKMVRFSLVTPEYTWNIDWTALPDNARPIRFKNMKRDFDGGGMPKEDPQLQGIDFGYQYTDDNGRNVEEKLNLKKRDSSGTWELPPPTLRELE